MSTDLEKANRVRIMRAKMKQAIKTGKLLPQIVLRWGPSEITDNMPIGDLIRAQRLWGNYRTTTFLTGLQIGSNRPIGMLTDHQRRELIRALDTVKVGTI